MEILAKIEWWVGQLGAIAITGTLGIIFTGIFRGLKRIKGEGKSQSGALFKPLFYILLGAAFFILCWWIWLPLPVIPLLWVRLLGLLAGAPLMFGGLILIVWGRLTLNTDYFVSTSRQAHLFAGHRLVTTGPYAIIRHPMYLGILWVGLGGILLYRTWTMVFISLMVLGLVVRARREEEALDKRFGEEWRRYHASVPGWLPRLKKR